MSRAERKLRKLKAEKELAELQAEKRLRQQQEWDDTKEKWAAMPSGVRNTIKVVGVIFVLVIIASIFSDPGEPAETQSKAANSQSEKSNTVEIKTEHTPKEKMLLDIVGLIDSRKAFDSGSYVKGDVPKGEYIFMPFDGGGKYYSEEDASGNIIDNENFDSFGYVYVHEVGNLTTHGALIPLSSLKPLKSDSAKEIYEKLNDITDYKGSGMYKVGTDLDQGQYTVQSTGEAYLELSSGPVGNGEILDNEIFNGRYSVSAQTGQYLSISRGEIVQ